MTMCGTGGWTGPLPGDPDNNISLSASAGFGGVRVSWSFPTTYPYAVAHVVVYRNTSNSYGGAIELARVNASSYFDTNTTDTDTTYYYWIVVVSVNGTYGAVIGPASALSRPTIAKVMEDLTGKIDRSVLGPTLTGKLDQIDTLDGHIAAEITNRIAANTALAEVVTDIDGVTTTAVATVQAIDIQRIADNTAIAAHIDYVAAGIGENIASVQTDMVAITEVQDGKILGIGARYTAVLTVNDLVGGFGIYNDGSTVSAGFDVDAFWVGRTSADKVKPFIIDEGETFIDQAVINKLTFHKLIADDGSFIVEDGKIKTDYIETKGMLIRAMDGTILFGAGTALDWSNVGGTGKPADGATRNVAKGSWVSGTVYVAGDSVLNGGYGWECILGHTSSGSIRPPTYPEESNTYWVITVVGGVDGAPGAPGSNGANGQGQVKAIAFIRGSSASAPGGGSFASPVPTGSPVWSDGIPADDTQPLWMTTRIFTSDGLAPQQSVWSTPSKVGIPSIGTRNVFSVLGTTASIGTTDATFHVTPVTADMYMGTQTSLDSGATWGAVVGKVKIKGENGLDGWAVYTATVYKQIGPDPGNPVATTSTYNFATGVLTPPAGWTVVQPSTTTVNTWACEYTFIGAAGSTVTGTGSWSATRIDAVAGAAGSNGVSINTVELYWQNATAPALPTGTTYDFSTNTVTGTLGSWVRTMPASTTVPTYMTSCTFTVTAPGTTQVRSVWSTAVVIAQKGSDGAAGGTGATGTRGSRAIYDVNAGVGAAGYNSLTTYVYGANAAGAASYAAKATDLIAAATSGSTPTTPIKGDTVTFSNGTTFVNTLTYTGSVWASPGVVVDGSLLVTGTVTADKINSNGLSIRDASGNVLFSSGVKLGANNLATGLDYAPHIAWPFQASALNSFLNYQSTFVGSAQYATLTATATDPQIYSPVIALAGGTYDKVRVRLRKTFDAVWEGSLFYSTAGHGVSSNYQKTIPWPVGVGLNEWVVLEWDMANLTAGGTDWKDNTIIGLRFDFSNVNGSAFQIDWISIGRYGPLQITADNIGTFIANAAIKSAQIGNLQVKSANIEELTVGTSKIANNAVTTSNGSVTASDFVQENWSPSTKASTLETGWVDATIGSTLVTINLFVINPAYGTTGESGGEITVYPARIHVYRVTGDPPVYVEVFNQVGIYSFTFKDTPSAHCTYVVVPESTGGSFGRIRAGSSATVLGTKK